MKIPNRELAEPHGPPAATVDVANLGAMQAQEVLHIPHARYVLDVPFTLTEATIDYTVPPNSLTFRVEMPEYCNYAYLQPTVRGNVVYLSVGGGMMWQLFGGVYWPASDYQSPSQGSVLVWFPTRRKWSVAATIRPTVLSANYADYARIILGYMPDTLARGLKNE